MQRFIIAAASASKPGEMGGNTKIAIEIARALSQSGWRVAVVVPASKLATFTENGATPSPTLEFVCIEDLRVGEFSHPVASTLHVLREYRKAFERLGAGPGDIVYAVCNFHTDILPLVALKRRFRFRYLATHFLFSPFIFENLARGYRLPALKWLLVWFYERALFLLAKAFADAFVITNHSDMRHFRRAFRERVFAFYGGVNIAQIPAGGIAKTRDAVFCSRLHPQKGVEGLLEIWARVVAAVPGAKLSIIGNGASDYEELLRRKAAGRGIADAVDWLGYVNNEEKFAIYASSKVFIHSTVFDNNGMVAAEALCTGLPVVMYDLPALRCVYREGCVKIPYGDKDAFAAAIAGLLRSPERRAAAAPTESEIAALRLRWDWRTRTREFQSFLEERLA